MHFDSDVGIIGAGPYALSCSAHFTACDVDHIVFGSPMKMWRENMPPGMCLKSDGFACTLYDPQRQLTLRQYCAERELAYADLGRPVPVETFIDYGLAFQAQLVPHLDRRLVKRLRPGQHLGLCSRRNLGRILQWLHQRRQRGDRHG
jgi:hypothetical protein